MSKVKVEQDLDLSNGIEAKLEMIKLLIPLGLQAIKEMLEEEVDNLAGEKYQRDESELRRWGSNLGSAYLGGQKVSFPVPRVRNIKNKQEIPLESYKALQNQTAIDDSVLAKVINGIATRKYEKVVEQVPEAFGLKKSTVSKKFIRASAKNLKKVLEKRLDNEDIVAIFMDGKTFSRNELIIALGVNMRGDKIVLGLIESASENSSVISDFLEELIERGLKIDDEILFILDGSKGLYSGVKKVFGEKAHIQRCQWHKRENVVSYLPKGQQMRMRRKLQNAYNTPSYSEAKRSLDGIKKELKLMNASSAKSLEEGLEETLTLQRLGLFAELGRSFKTTNCIENLNRQIEQYTGRVCRWKTSDQRQRWVASAIVEIEPHLRKIKGHHHLKTLRERMKTNQPIVKERLAA